MRINEQNKTMDLEARDINYILPAYVRSYLFYSKNEMPTKIIFPMFPSVQIVSMNNKTTTIPIEYVSPLDEIAVEIAKDGSNVAEVTPEQEAKIDEKEAGTEALKTKMAGLTEPTPTPEDLIRQQEENAQQAADEAADHILEIETEPKTESPAKAAFKVDPNPAHQLPADRVPKTAPGGDIGPGAGPSDMQPRGRDDQSRTARDLLEEPEIEGAPEKEFEKEISRDGQGKPVVEDKPNAPSG